MKYELSQRFFFEAAHTLQRQRPHQRDRDRDTQRGDDTQRGHDPQHGDEVDASRRIHGHTYHAKVTIAGQPDPNSGMVADLAVLRESIERVKARLDHRLLDEVDGLGPATLENLCGFIQRHLDVPGCPVVQVEVAREASGDSCCLRTGG